MFSGQFNTTTKYYNKIKQRGDATVSCSSLPNRLRRLIDKIRRKSKDSLKAGEQVVHSIREKNAYLYGLDLSIAQSMNNPFQLRQFQKSTETHLITASYSPSRLTITATHLLTKTIQQSDFYDATLPKKVSKEWSAVDKLYNGLEARNNDELQITSQSLKIKMLAKKEKWVALPIGQSKIIEQVTEQEKWTKEKEKLIEQNKRLKKEITALRRREKRRTMKKQEQTTEDQASTKTNDTNALKRDIKKKEPEIIPVNIPLTCLPNPVCLHLTPNKRSVGYIKYSVNGTKVIKKTEKQGSLIFQDALTMWKGQSYRIGLRVESKLHNGWIIFGLIRKQYIHESFCYFRKSSVAFSGSIGSVFVELEALDIGITPKIGDTIEFILHSNLLVIQWLINGRIVCLHRMPREMASHKLYPFVMLAQPGESISFNCFSNSPQ